MKANILDLRLRMGDVMRAIERGEPVTILYRGKDKAVLMPVSQTKPPISVKEHAAFGMWKDREDLSDPTEVVRAMRKGRNSAL